MELGPQPVLTSPSTSAGPGSLASRVAQTFRARFLSPWLPPLLIAGLTHTSFHSGARGYQEVRRGPAPLPPCASSGLRHHPSQLPMVTPPHLLAPGHAAKESWQQPSLAFRGTLALLPRASGVSDSAPPQCQQDPLCGCLPCRPPWPAEECHRQTLRWCGRPPVCLWWPCARGCPAGPLSRGLGLSNASIPARPLP